MLLLYISQGRHPGRWRDVSPIWTGEGKGKHQIKS